MKENSHMMYYCRWESTFFLRTSNRIKKEYANFADSPNFSFKVKVANWRQSGTLGYLGNGIFRILCNRILIIIMETRLLGGPMLVFLMLLNENNDDESLA